MSKFWNGESLEAYLPIVCDNCQKEVSINGVLKQDKIVGDCPNCHTEYEIVLKQAGEEVVESPLAKATFTLKIQDLGKIKNMEYAIDRCNTPGEIALAILDVLASILSDEKMSPYLLFDQMIKEIIPSIYNSEGLGNLGEFIKGLNQNV